MNEVMFIALLLLAAASTSHFRSYHPQYLHSYSYPQPSTLHLYYGRVMNNRPRFLIQQGEESIEAELFTVNDEPVYIDAARNRMRRQLNFARRLDCMLMFAIEDSKGYTEIEEARLEVGASAKSFIIAMVNGTESKAYILQATKNNIALPIEDYPKRNLSVTFRNVSDDPKQNWMLSRSTSWSVRSVEQPQNISEEPQPGTPRYPRKKEDSVSSQFFNWALSKPRRYLPISQTSYSAVAFQISLPITEVGGVRIYVNEVKLSNLTEGTTAQQIFKQANEQYENTSDRSVRYSTTKKTCNIQAIDLVLKGLSYEYGELMIAHNSIPVANEARGLLSFSPSRKRFPWGFLWDDGFHNEVVSRSQPALSLKVIKSWLDTMIDGWIPRQQNRGSERVYLCNCALFMTKDDRDGNPPSLVLPLTYLLNSEHLTLEVLGDAYWGKIKQWHAWYMKTQMTAPNSHLFKWFDHITSEGSFNSGMDDFPRVPNSIYHVDAQCWMYKITKFMWHASQKFEPNAADAYYDQLTKIHSNLRKMLDPNRKIFVDVYTDRSTTTVASTTVRYSPHVGYGSILPIAFGMLEPYSAEFNATLELMTDPNMLNTSHGLSSIATTSPYYLMNRDAYWRGPVWINMNYLALRGMKIHYPEAAQEVYTRLRYQLIKTVCGQWDRSGYFYENYIRGRGSFSYPFNGWTSLIALIVTEEY